MSASCCTSPTRMLSRTSMSVDGGTERDRRRVHRLALDCPVRIPANLHESAGFREPLTVEQALGEVHGFPPRWLRRPPRRRTTGPFFATCSWRPVRGGSRNRCSPGRAGSALARAGRAGSARWPRRTTRRPVSCDSDFARFEGLRWESPLQATRQGIHIGRDTKRWTPAALRPSSGVLVHPVKSPVPVRDRGRERQAVRGRPHSPPIADVSLGGRDRERLIVAGPSFRGLSDVVRRGSRSRSRLVLRDVAKPLAADIPVTLYSPPDDRASGRNYKLSRQQTW